MTTDIASSTSLIIDKTTNKSTQLFSRINRKLQQYEQRLTDVDGLFRRRKISFREDDNLRHVHSLMNVNETVNIAGSTCTIAVATVAPSNKRVNELVSESNNRSATRTRRLSLPHVTCQQSASQSLSPAPAAASAAAAAVVVSSRQRHVSVCVQLPDSTTDDDADDDADETNITSSTFSQQFIAKCRDCRTHLVQLTADVCQLETSMTSEVAANEKSLQEASEHRQHLEQQLIDFIELHQTEINNMKQTVMTLQEKMEYRLDERARDLNDLLESCQTKMAKMELQQQQQQQLGTNSEAVDNSCFRVIIIKLVNVTLTILALLFIFTSTASLLATQLTATRFRCLATISSLLTVAALCCYRASSVDYSVDSIRCQLDQIHQYFLSAVY